jgi:hypothetical protein
MVFPVAAVVGHESPVAVAMNHARKANFTRRPTPLPMEYAIIIPAS